MATINAISDETKKLKFNHKTQKAEQSINKKVETVFKRSWHVISLIYVEFQFHIKYIVKFFLIL